MGHEIQHVCPVEARRLVWLIGMGFAFVLLVQYFELPYGRVVTSIFSVSKPHVSGTETLSTEDSSAKSNILRNMTFSEDLNSTNLDTFHRITSMTNAPDGKDIIHNNDLVPGKNRASNVSVELDRDSDPEDEAPSKDMAELSRNSTGDVTVTDNGLVPEHAREPPYDPQNGASDNNNSADGNKGKEITAPSALRNENTSAIPAATSVALPPAPSPPNSNTSMHEDTYSRNPVISALSNTSSMDKGLRNTLPKDEKYGELGGDTVQSENSSSKAGVPTAKESFNSETAAVVSVAEMNDMFLQSRASTFSMKPRWSSAVDQDLLNAQLQIVNAPMIENDPRLYAPLYRNVSMFKRSYNLMEQMLKVFIYREGERPIFHTPVLKGIYASEGWFMKLLKANKQFVTRNPKKAHLFYLPFSSRMLEETLYVPNSHSHKNLIQHLKNYLDMIAARYSFWNRTGGADHFLVACHDWAPSETRQHMANCIRALCNSDVKEGFKFGKDVSLPETYILSPQNPLRELGGKPPSQRRILAFFAGNMHGYLRPILLQHWENKDPDMKIFGRMRKVKGQMNYVQHMKSSKYCICAKGYEVNSPRVVEAIFYECVPVIISDNFVPPFFEVLNWESFAVFVAEKDIPNLKNILVSIPQKRYLQMQRRVKKVQQHFLWHARPEKYDIFHMILHSIWFNRVFQIRPI